MGPGTVFDRLVSDMSVQERQELLSRVQLATKVDDAPLAAIEATEESDFEALYRQLSFWSKLMLSLRAIFSGRERLALLSDIAFKKLGQRIAGQAATYFSVRTIEFTAAFSFELKALQSGLRLFDEPLKRILGPEKRDFIAFLAGLEMPEVQDNLIAETDLSRLVDNPLLDNEDSVRREIEIAVEDALVQISEDDRTVMGRHTTALRYLGLLVRFPFERILRSFGEFGQRADVAQKLLEELAGLLEGFVVPPSAKLLEALFLFSLSDEPSADEPSLEDGLRALIARANGLVAQIRDFNYRIPLRDILRFSLRRLDWTAPAAAGGEDWFALYQQFWADRLTAHLAQHRKDRRRRELLNEAASFINLAKLPLLAHYRADWWNGEVSFQHEHSLAFIAGFVNQVFPLETSRTTKTFLIDGRFYKEENRRDFTDCYDRINRVVEAIKKLDDSLSSEGEQGQLIRQALGEAHTPGTRARRTERLIAAADRQARGIVMEMIATFDLFANLVDGILHGQGDSTFDSVTNLAFIGGRENPRLRASLGRIFTTMQRTVEILKGLFAFETESDT